MLRASRRKGWKMIAAEYEIDWGVFALVEFLVTNKSDIGSKFRTAIDIGSGAGIHSQLMEKAGLQVFQLDKYNPEADYQVDFLSYDFDRKFDVVFCSHVIEHQRNVGLFLDKIFDIMNPQAALILSAPKHDAAQMVEGHLNCFYSSYFIQHVVHAGFNMKKGSYLSCGQLENAAIVFKDSEFDPSERLEAGYVWTDRHQRRSFVPLRKQIVASDASFFYNCSLFSIANGSEINCRLPESYIPYGIKVNAKRWGFCINI